MELKIDSEKVKQAANSCPEAKRILEILFPGQTAPGDDFNLRALTPSQGGVYLFTLDKARKAGFNNESFMQVRSNGEYAGKAFFLDCGSYSWELKTDKDGSMVLIPRRKAKVPAYY